MNDFKNNIDKMVSKILSEEIEKKSKQVSEQIDEELKGNQKKLDVAKPKGKITAADFKKLRDAKKHKKEVEEYYHSDIKNLGDFEDDEDDIRKRYKMMDEPYSDDGDYSGMRKVMKKRYNKDMGISDDEDFAKSDKEEMDEFYFYDDEEDESTPGDYEGDEEVEDEAEELSAQEPTYVGRGLRKPKMIASFDDDHGWFDDTDSNSRSDVFSDYDEEEFPDHQSLMSKYGKNQNWFSDKPTGEMLFNKYLDKFGGKPFRVRTPKSMDMDEAETEEGNAFSGALAKAKESGDDSFEVDGKKYSVKEARDKFDGRKSKVIGVDSNIKKQREMKEDDDKFIQKIHMKKGALHKKLGIPEGDKIPQSKLKSLKAELHKKSEGDKKLSAADSKLLKQVNLALTLKC